MRSICFIAACLFAGITLADGVGPEQNGDPDPQAQADGQDVKREAPIRDDDKFEDAKERRKQRRQAALDERRKRNLSKSHVYALTRFVPAPAALRPFDLQRDLNRGEILGPFSGASFGIGSARGRSIAANTAGATPALTSARPEASQRSLRILFLRAGGIAPDGIKAAHLRENGHAVINPELPNDFRQAVRVAEFAADKYRPHVIVGDSRGGAVALNMNSGDTPIVLLRPDWKNFGSATTTKRNSILLHSPTDSLIAFANSEELRSNSGLPSGSLVSVGQDESLADPVSLRVLLEACVRLGPK